MARKPMTDEEKKARAEKSRATRALNQKRALEQLGLPTERKKIRRARKPMTEEQRKAAGERLAKARAAKSAANGTPAYASYDESLRNLPDDDPFSIKNVLEWVKYQKALLQGMRGFRTSKNAKERAQFTQTQTYIENLEKYLRNGVYLDSRYGKEGTDPVLTVCRKMAYYKDGTPKRTEGVWYPDICAVWEKDMEEM